MPVLQSRWVDTVPVAFAAEEIDITNVTDLRAASLRAAALGSAIVEADVTRTRF
jgi:hypothetical protein